MIRWSVIADRASLWRLVRVLKSAVVAPGDAMESGSGISLPVRLTGRQGRRISVLHPCRLRMDARFRRPGRARRSAECPCADMVYPRLEPGAHHVIDVVVGITRMSRRVGLVDYDTDRFFLGQMTLLTLVFIEHEFRRDKRETLTPVRIIIMVRRDVAAAPAEAGGAEKFEANMEIGMVHLDWRSGVAAAICDRGLPGYGSRCFPSVGA